MKQRRGTWRTRDTRSCAPDDLDLGHDTQAWLAVTDDPQTAGAGYWYHRERQEPASAALDASFQDALLDQLAALTGVGLTPSS